VKAKDPVRIIRFIDALLAEENQRIMEWGIEGQDWQRNDKGEPYRTPEQRTNWDDQVWQLHIRAMLLREVMPVWEGSWTDGYPTALPDFFPEREAATRPEDKELWAAYGVTSYAELMDKDPQPNALWFPTWTMPNPPDGSDAQIAFQRAEQTMRKYLPQVILAAPGDFEQLWAEYVAQMQRDGIGTYEAYMQEQLDLRIKQWTGN
jgi:putative aldouronate transport system substrate-binding protein